MRSTVRAVGSPVLPGAHERVLENGELVGIIRDIGQKPLDQARGDLAPTHSDRALDRQAPLIAVQAGDQSIARG
jgi:hypothetical protein